MYFIIKIKNIGILFAMLFLLFSCENHVQENDEIVEVEKDNCDANVSFSTSIKTIIDNNCLPCHRSQFPNLTNYNSIRDNASNIRGQVVSRRMPQGGSLTSQEIELIKCWIDNGATNN